MDIKRGDNNEGVKIIQEWLTLSGHGVDIDGGKPGGGFGPATEAAVRAFQAANRLGQTGIVDKTTMALLCAPLERAKVPVMRKTSEGLTVVYTAKKHLKEHPREAGGDNRGPWVRHYMRGAEGKQYPWCAGFVCTILEQAFKAHSKRPPFTYTVGCDRIAEVNRSILKRPDKGAAATEVGLGPGALFLNRKTETDWTHVGIVTAFNSDHIETIEGNTNTAGSREGIEVRARMRGYKNKDFVPV